MYFGIKPVRESTPKNHEIFWALLIHINKKMGSIFVHESFSNSYL